MKFIVDPRVFSILPNACFGIVSAGGIDNTKSYPEISEMLSSAVRSTEERFAGKKVKEDPLIIPYREAFQKLNINPNKFMSSIEALVTRISKGKGLPSINPIVDLVNALSLKYLLPMGAHDIDQMDGDLQVRFSTANDTFLPFGETELEVMPENELVYVVGTHVRTRRWIWRQSEIGKINPNSSNVIFPIDGFADVNKEAVLNAREELADLCKKVLCCREVHIGFVDKENMEFHI